MLNRLAGENDDEGSVRNARAGRHILQNNGGKTQKYTK